MLNAYSEVPSFLLRWGGGIGAGRAFLTFLLHPSLGASISSVESTDSQAQAPTHILRFACSYWRIFFCNFPPVRTQRHTQPSAIGCSKHVRHICGSWLRHCAVWGVGTRACPAWFFCHLKFRAQWSIHQILQKIIFLFCETHHQVCWFSGVHHRFCNIVELRQNLSR